MDGTHHYNILGFGCCVARKGRQCFFNLMRYQRLLLVPCEIYVLNQDMLRNMSRAAVQFEDAPHLTSDRFLKCARGRLLLRLPAMRNAKADQRYGHESNSGTMHGWAIDSNASAR